MIYPFFILCFVLTPCFGFLKIDQWKRINDLIRRPDLSPEIRITINKVIYKHYCDWALYQTIEFKKYHYYKCKKIPLEELHLYCLEGLQKGIERYDASSSFFNYIQYYIRGRLYKGMTELQPVSNVSLRKRMRKKNKKSNTVFVGENDWIFDKVLQNKESTTTTWDTSYEKKVKIWEFIHKSFSSKDKRIMEYKYDFDFNELRSNKKVAELMVYSEEKIQVQLYEMKKKIGNENI